MPELVTTAIVTSFISAAIGAAVGAVVSRIKTAKSAHDHADEKEKAMQAARDKALRTLLRNELVQMHRYWVEEKGYITLEALEYAEDTYTTYHDLGGNGSGTKLWLDLKALPIKE